MSALHLWLVLFLLFENLEHRNEKCTAAKIAEELKIADKTVSNQLSEIKCSLRESITPYFREAI